MAADMNAEHKSNDASQAEFSSRFDPVAENYFLDKDSDVLEESEVDHADSLQESASLDGSNKLGGLRGRVAAGTLAALAALGIGGYFASQQMDGDDGERKGVTSDVTDNTPPSTKVDKPTFTVVPEATDTPAPVLTETNKNPLEQGSYASVEEMPISEDDKATIKEMLKGSTPFIITDKVIIAIEDDLKTRTTCPDRIGVENSPDILCTSMEAMKLNLDIPDTIQRLNEGILRNQYDLWERDAQSGLSFEEYKAQTEAGITHPFTVRAYDFEKTEIIDRQVQDEKKPVIIKHVSQPDDVFIENSTQKGQAFIVHRGIYEMDVYSSDPIGFGEVSGYDGIPTERSQAAQGIINGLITQLDPALEGLILDGSVPHRLVEGTIIETLKTYREVLEHYFMIGIHSDTDGRSYEDSIFRTKGEYHNKNIPRSPY